MRFLSWAKCLTCTVLLCAFMKYQKADGIKTTPHPKDCIYNDNDRNIYNLTTIRNSDGTPRFEAPGKDPYYRFSFNPCISFTLGRPWKRDLDCQSDVAICEWSVHEGPYNYYRIGSQSSVQFGFYKKPKIPALNYSSPGHATVLLKCDVNEEKGTFIAWKGWDGSFHFVFNLTHKCACPNACLIRVKDPTAAPSDPNDNILVKGVTLGVGGAVLFIIVTFIIAVIFPRKLVDSCRRLFRRQPNDEQRAILGENRGAEIDTKYNIPPIASGGSELAPGRGSSCSGITVPNKKDDLNARNRIRTDHFGNVL